MELRFSVVASDRRFAQAMRRIRPRFDSLVTTFAAVELVNPIHQAILVGITDDKEPGFLEVVPNSEEFFQVLAGVSNEHRDDELVAQVFDVLHRAVMACPFSNPDREAIQQVFADSKAKLAQR